VTSPNAKLHVAGTGGGGYLTTNKFILQRTDATNPTAMIEFEGSGGAAGTRWQITSDADVANDFGIAYGGTKFLQVLSGGNVGIGITAPVANLDVKDSNTRTGTHMSSGVMYVTGGLGAASGIEFRHYNGTQGIGFGYNTIYATGSNTNQELVVQARGSSALSLIGNSATITVGGTTGNVGIGDTSPAALLTVGSGDKFQVDANGTITAAGDAYIQGMDNYPGAGGGIPAASYVSVINSTGQLVKDGDTGHDYAERMPADHELEPGDVVSITQGDIGETNKGFHLVKSKIAYDPLVAGVISENGIALGEYGPDYKTLGLVGQLKVKVTNENGPIKFGDYLTTSNTPGHAMKAKGKNVGIIGQALADFDGKKGKILILVKTSK
jgi:hypothetical protein